MEDDNGIELSLGLSCGGSGGKSKGKDGSTSDIKTADGGNSNKLMGDLKNFLHTGIQKLESDNVSQRSDPVKPQENFFTDLAKPTLDADASMNLQGNIGPQFTRYGEPWIANSNKSAEVEEEKTDHQEIGGKLWSGVGNKRKTFFEEINHQKKHVIEIQDADSHGNNTPMGISTAMKTSHGLLTVEDGSTTENEVVAESETEGSSSRLVSHNGGGTKRYTGGGSSFDVPKESHGFNDLSFKDIQGQKQSNIPPGNESMLRCSSYGIPSSLQPLNVMTVPSLPVKGPNTSLPSTSGYPPHAMQLMPPANSEPPGSQSMNPSNLQLTYGYSPAKLPTLETDHSWAMVSHPQQFPSYAGRSIGNATPNSDKSEDGLKISQAVQASPHNSSGPLPYDGKASELAKGGGKHHAVEEAGVSSSSQTEDEVRRNGMIFKPKEASDQPEVDGFLHEGSNIRPGIAPGVKFGGCGSYPDLPWVSTTAPGPNGRTISGVTYRYSKNQIKIVCACHGSHMSPEEFIQHATSDLPNSENNTSLPSFPSNNPAASAQS